jgi:hypothetical protein
MDILRVFNLAGIIHDFGRKVNGKEEKSEHVISKSNGSPTIPNFEC